MRIDASADNVSAPTWRISLRRLYLDAEFALGIKFRILIADAETAHINLAETAPYISAECEVFAYHIHGKRISVAFYRLRICVFDFGFPGLYLTQKHVYCHEDFMWLKAAYYAGDFKFLGKKAEALLADYGGNVSRA